jgi:ankyrin repeat protein
MNYKLWGANMTSNEEVMAAVQAGDAEKLRALLAKNSALASARDASGVSAIMHSLYRRQAEMTKLLLAAGPDLDLFEATTLGRRERVAELLQRDPALAKSWSPDGFTALHLACFFAQ